MSNPERLPPQNREAEEAVLGSVLIDPDAIFDVVSFLKPDMFYSTTNRWIFDAIVSIHARNEPVDILTVLEELRRRDQLEEIGGEATLAGLVGIVPTSVNAESYGRIVEAASIRRDLLNAAGEIAKMAYEEEEDISVVLDRAESKLFAISEERTTKDLVSVRDIAASYLARIEELHAQDQEIVGVPTGFLDLDRLLGGLNKSDLIILAARPGMGKTSLQNGIALTAAKTYGKRIAIFNLEMSGEQLVQRMLASETRIDIQRLRRGQLQDHEWPIFYEAVQRLSETRIYIDDTPSISPMQLRTKCRRLYAEHGLDLVMIDYLQLMQGDKGTNNRVQEIGDISRGLKVLARELNVPVVAAAQLSRGVESRQEKKPLLSDLRDSGCLTGDTLITLAESGQRKPIRELVGKSGFKVWSLNLDSLKIEPGIVSHAFSTGKKKVFKMTTRLGRTIRATGNHKFLAFNGWTRLDQLSETDLIALPRLKQTTSNRTMSDESLALLGHLIGDGCVLPRHSIQYTTRELDLAEEVSNLSEVVFGNQIKPRIKKERRWYQVYLSSSKPLTHGKRNPISVWFDEMGIFGLRSFEKFVPASVFSQPKEAIAVFLRHLWATDGCIKLKKVGNRHYPAIYYATSSKQLANDVQTLLLMFEINARIKRVTQGEKGRDQFHIHISGLDEIEQFVKQIGAIGKYKSGGLDQVKEYISERKPNTNRDIIPSSVWRQLVVPAMQNQGMTSREMQAAIHQPYSGTSLYKQNMSRSRALRVSKAVQSESLLRLATSDLYWDKIVSIEPDGFEEVFDLTVPGNHNFLANEIVVHNSIEQDADIVMFIYRDDYYNPESSERPGIAEIIVAKHRNGPTASIDLYWNAELASFANLQRQEVQL